MTHDELLDKATNHAEVEDCWMAVQKVIKLHKPIKDEWFNVGDIICEECTREEYTRLYPCPTIEAIEKELR